MIMIPRAVIFVLLSSSVATVTVTAEADSAYQHPVIQSMSSDLSFDENNRLSKHTIVYDATNPTCDPLVRLELQKHLTNTPLDDARFDITGVEGDALDRVFGPHKNEGSGCLAACIERGVQRDLAGYVMPEYVYDCGNVESSKEDVTQWFQRACTGVEICLLSYHSKEHPLEVYWKRSDGEMIHHLSLDYGERHTRCFHTFLGHQFVAIDESDPKNPVQVGELTVEYITVQVWGTSPPSDERAPSHNFVNEIEATLNHEWTRHQRVTRTFSPLGFKKGKLPKDIFASLGAFYYNNAQNFVREEWTHKGVFVNWWETDVLFLQIPWDMKQIYLGRLRTMVEEWAGVPVEQTVMYGLRQYTEGARLLTHVDRHSTHAVSLIVNVAQGNLTEPWPVEVQDHADRLHEVLMEPGDVVYYESAKCLHGRNRAMKGPQAYYVNMFTHYRPTDDPMWFSRPNPEGTPEPVLGDRPVTEECKLVNKGIAAIGSARDSVGLLRGVQCENPQLGDFLSPTLFQATGPGDLIDWWRKTDPNNEELAVPSNEPATESANSEGEL